MSQWKFQILPNIKGAFGNGYRMDSVGETFETDINNALKYPFKFHGVNKLVIALGPPPFSQTPDFIEMDGVLKKQYEAFCLDEYLNASDEDRTLILTNITQDVFRWILENFKDADFIVIGAKNLGWHTLLKN